jgi:DNA uptake protein ComE-like DNA-binding protein
MPLRRTTSVFLLSCAVALLAGSTGCNFSSQDQRERDAKTRDEVAKATERAKPALEEAGHELDKVGDEAVHAADAAAQAVRNAWNNSQHSLVDVNSATEAQLLDLPGIDKLQARKIIDHRPYADKHDLLAKGTVSSATYAKITDQITAN